MAAICIFLKPWLYRYVCGLVVLPLLLGLHSVKTMKEVAFRICHPFVGLFNFSLSFTFIFNSKSFKPPK